MDPLVKAYLKTHTFRQLEDEHGVCARPNAHGDKFSLNYDQILVKNGDPLAEQCRGMVVRPMNLSFPLGVDWKDLIVGDVAVLAWPMNRFYNHGDAAGAQVDWDDPGLRVYEKLDGTMMVVYWDPLHQRWFAGTRSVPEADLPICKDHMEIGDMTFSGLFFRALRETREEAEGKPLQRDPAGFDQVVHLNKELTYVFELTSQFNRVVVKYDAPRVTLLAARHTASGEELPIESLCLQHVNQPKTWNLRSVAALEAFVNNANPALLEGAVVCDSQFRRLKVKNKAWVLSSRAKDLVTCSRRAAVLAIINDQIDDVLSLVAPDIADELESMREAIGSYLTSIDNNFVSFRDQAGNDRKTFAMLVVGSGDWTPAYFSMWEKRSTSASEWIRSQAAAGKLNNNALDVILTKIKAAK